MSFKLLDGSASLWGGEPIYHNGERVGKLTSGGIGHTVNDGGAIGKETRLLRRFTLKVIILPRQARDKHRENSERDAFLQVSATSPPPLQRRRYVSVLLFIV